MLNLGRHAVQLLRAALAGFIGVLFILLLAAGGLVWRLNEGPVDVTGLAGWLARREAPDTTLGRVTVALSRSPSGDVIRLNVTDALYPAEPGQPSGSLRSGKATLALRPLLHGTVAPQELVLDGLHARLTWPNPDGKPNDARPDIQRLLTGLRHLSVTDSQVELTDGSVGQPLRFTVASAELTRADDGRLSGHAAATAAVASVSAQLDIQGEDGPDGPRLLVTSSPVSPAALAQAVPALAALGALDAAVSLRVDAAFDPAMTLRRAVVHAEAGPGVVQLPAKGGITSPARFTSMVLDADGDLQSMTLHALRVVLTPSANPPSTLVLSGTAARAGNRFDAHAVLDLDHAALADLPTLWPPGVGGGSRGWLTENLTAGTVHDGHATFTVTGTQGSDDLALTAASGTLIGEDVSVWWLRPVPPLAHGHVVVTWQNPDNLLIAVTGAQQGGLVARTGSVHIDGLTGKDQVADIAADLQGQLGDVVTLLRYPRLKILSAHPIAIGAPSGAVSDQITIRVPLESKVSIDDVTIHSHGQVTDAHLGGIVAGRDLDHGQLVVDVTNDGLTVGGTAQVDHIAGKLAVDMDFRAGPPVQVVQHVAATLRLTEQEAKTAGLDEIGLGAGFVLANVDYTERRNGSATVRLAANLTEAAFKTPLGWSKTVGSAGHAEGQIELLHGKVVAVDDIRAQAPGLSIAARSDVVNGRPSVVHIERGEIGRSSATGTIGLPKRDGDPYLVTLSGPRLDLEGLLAGRGGASPPAKAGVAGSAFSVDLRFGQVMLGPMRSLGPMALTASSNGHGLQSARLLLGGTDAAQVTVHPVTGGRQLHAEVANVGLLLQATALASEIDGGVLTLDGLFEDKQASSPFDGTLDLRDFTVRGAPVMGKVLQGLTVYGLGDALRGPGLSFDRMIMPFRLEGSVLTMADARAFSSSLGLTATGRLDFARKQVDLNGTIVPAYFFNSLPGRIPWLGRLFSPEKASGLFAVSFGLRGSLADPSLSINPLSALTPGFTRKFFDLF